MTAPWQDIRCASVPEASLAVLADLRREPGIRATIAGGRAWIRWDDSLTAEAVRRILVERLLPVAGVEVFARRDGRWHRPGEALPAFDLPIDQDDDTVSLARAIVPGRREIIAPPIGDAPRPVSLRLARDDRRSPRPATAARCDVQTLARWADGAPTAWIEALAGAWCPSPGGEPEVLVIGPAARLPATDDARRFWGDGVLIPLGYRADPELTEPALKAALEAGPDDLVVLDEAGAERIPRDAFRTLHRASIRLAARTIGGGPP